MKMLEFMMKISLKFAPKGPNNDIQALVQIMAWRRPGDKPLSEPMMVSLLTHICVNRPQWVKAECIWGRTLQGTFERYSVKNETTTVVWYPGLWFNINMSSY